jgi:hypothetical protein
MMCMALVMLVFAVHPVHRCSLQTAAAAVEDGSLQRSGSMPRSSSATTRQSGSALRRSSTMPNDRRGSKVSFGATLQVRQHATAAFLPNYTSS